MGTRAATLIGGSCTLGLRNISNGVLTDAYQIVGIKILDPDYVEVGFIDGSSVVRLDLGTYQAIAPGTLFTRAGSYHDVWQVIPAQGSAVSNITFDINVVTTLTPPAPDFGALLQCRLADLDACRLKKNYLWPVWTTLSNGWYLPDQLLQHHIDVAMTWAQRQLGIPLRQVKVLTKPYAANQTPTNPVKGVDYQEDGDLIQWSVQSTGNWSSIRLPNSGIIRVLNVRGIYGGRTVYNIPDEWVLGNELKNGYVRIRPTTAGTINQIVDNNGQFLDITLLEAIGNTTVPGFWAIDYVYGQEGDIFPEEICDLIMKKAAVILLDQLGMAISRGIQSRSAQVDGLGSTIGLLASAERTQFGALCARYEKELADVNLMGMRQYYRGPVIFMA